MSSCPGTDPSASSGRTSHAGIGPTGELISTSSVSSPCAVCGVPAQKKPLDFARSTRSGSSVSRASSGRETVVCVG